MVDSQPLSVHMLGAFRIHAGHETVAGFDQARLRELLAYLLLHRGRPVVRQHLAFLFWPDSTEEQARTNLRTLWHRLRRSLPDADLFLTTDESTLQWRRDAPCWLDVAEFETRLELARSSSDENEQIQHLERAAAVYGGDLMPGFYSDWLLTARPDGAARPQLLIVATLRSEESEAGSAFAEWLAGWRTELARARQLTEIELGPLSQDATLALADRVAGRPFDRALGSLLYEGTEGHPLFIVEMVRAGFAGETPASAQAHVDHAARKLPDAPALPARVRQVLEARLAQLSPTALGVVELAAVVGRAFSFAVLTGATDLSEDLLVASLDECWRKRILREQGEDAYDFSHDKLREAAYAGLSRTRRRWLHGRVAQALETLHAGALERVAGAIADHYEAAGQPVQAVAYYRQAASAARSVYAHADALAALDKAMSLLVLLSDQAARREWVVHVEEARGDLRELLMQHAPAQDAYFAALACVPAGNSITQARLHRKIGKTLETWRGDYDEVDFHYATAEALLGDPEEGAESAWWKEWCEVQLQHLILLYWWARPDAMAERLARCRALIERHGTPQQRASLFENINRQLMRSNRFAPSKAAVENGRAALAVLPSSTPPELIAPHLFSVGFYLLWHGDHAEAEATLGTAREMAEQTGDVSLQVRCLAYLAVVHRRQGRMAEVETTARRCLAAAEAVGMLEYGGAGLANLAWVAWMRGDLAESERLAQGALDAWRLNTKPYPLYWQALWPLIGVALAQDRLVDAIPFVRKLCDPGQQALPAALDDPLAAGLAAWDAGQLDTACDLLRRAVGLARQMNLS